MDKNTFLEELRKSLRVLKDEEVQDIIGEYEQHIDLKVQKGLTVEQAIADFGNVKELATEILEGYHVKAEFEVNNEERVTKKGLLSSGREVFNRSVRKLWRLLGSIWSSIINGFLWCGKQAMRPFIWVKSKWNEKGVQQGNVAPKETSHHVKEWVIHKMKGLRMMILRLWNWLIQVSIWCLRICWNCVVIGSALTIGGFALMCLFAVGVLVVLLAQGYPVTGVTIGSLGLALCLFSATVLIWTMIWRKSQTEPIKEENAEPIMTELTEMEEGQHA